MAMEKLLARISKALGIPDEEINAAMMTPEQLEAIDAAESALEIAKGTADFESEIDDSAYVEIAKRDFTADERQKARFSIDGRFPMNNCSDVSNARQALGRAKPADRPRIEALIRRAASAFKCNIEGSVVEKSDESNRGTANVRGMDETNGTVEENTGTIEERMDDLESAFEELPAKIAKAIKDSKDEEETKPPTPEELGEKIDKLATDTAEAVKEIGEQIEKLGAGGSAQGEEIPAEQNGKAARIAKAFEERDLDPRLQGIL